MFYRFRKLTAWLGLVTLWLTVLMPLASQWHAQAARFDLAAPLCSAQIDRPEQSASQHSENKAAQHHLHLDACGYCSLLAHSPAMGAALQPFDIRIAFIANVKSFVLLTIERPLARYLRAYPRAPPPISL